MSFTPLLRRIREDKTNYRKRKGLLIGRHTFSAVRLSNENVQVQISKPSKVGDNVLVSAHSRELTKHGWKGSRKNMPACYLTGLLAGTKAAAKGVKEGVLYTGNRKFTPRIAATVKGLIDAGVSIAVGEEALPNEDRISGKHISDYASMLKGDNQNYNARFSGLLKNGFTPERYQDHFDEVKASILGKQVSRKEVVKEVREKKAEVKGVKEVAKVPEKKVEPRKEKKAEKKEKEKDKETRKKKEPKTDKGGKKR